MPLSSTRSSTICRAPAPRRGPQASATRIAHLQAKIAASSTTGGAPATPPSGRRPPELAKDDREHFVFAVRMFRAGNVPSAYDAARRLFATYRDVSAVQDLRCQLATVRWLEKEAVQKRVRRYYPPG